MSLSKAVMRDREAVQRILDCYCADDRPTAEDTAKRCKVTHHTVMAVLKQNMDPERYRIEKAIRYSRSKLGENSYLWGKSGALHPHWIGDVSDQKGYLTRKIGKRRYFVHRIAMAGAIGIPVQDLPESLTVHHIDGDGTNNNLSNLALVNREAHGVLHSLRLKYSKLPMWVKMVSGTLKLKETTPTSPVDS